ncbi:MAG TPA: hypothetical protein VJG32_05145 [Anaerolineae bacterium]|nr:hypothetical protein [Anaerolineae bacterium]
MAQLQPVSASAAAGGIAVAGNVEGNIVVGDNNFVVNTNYGTIVYKQAAPQARLRDATPQPPRAPRGFVGRSKELAELGRLIAASEAVTLYGVDGAGKSALLRQAANGEAARALPNGVVLLEGVDERGEALGLEDVIQRLFDALFESDPPLKVNATTARTYLSNTRPLVVLDGLNLPATSLATLPDLLPQGALLIASPRSPSGDATQPMKVGPLQRAESIQLLAARAGLELDEATRAALDAMCALLTDVPLALVTAANAIRENNLPLDRARQILRAATPGSSDPLRAGVERAWALVNSMLSGDDRQLLAFAAMAPGVSVDPGWLAQMTGGGSGPGGQIEIEGGFVNVGGVRVPIRGEEAERETPQPRSADAMQSALDRMQAMGLLRANSPRLRIDPGLRALWQSGMDETAARDGMLAYLLRAAALDKFRDWQFCADELGNVLGMIEWAAAQGRWAEALQLSRAIDPYLTLHGLWDTWRAILNRTLQAARESHSPESEAWALHQLGAHAIGQRQAQQAIDLLRQALDLRRSLGDATGMAYTQHNLDLLIPPAPPSRGESGPQAGPPAPGMSTALKAMIGIGAAAVVIGSALLLNRPAAAPVTQPSTAASVQPITPGSTIASTEAASVPSPSPVGASASAVPSPSPTATVTPTRLLVAPQIAFLSDRDNRFSPVYLLDPDTLAVTPVDSDLDVLSVVLSPDGSRLLILAFVETGPVFYTANVDGSGQRQLTDREVQRMPAWSPDSARLAFSAPIGDEPESTVQVFVANADGSEEVQVTRDRQFQHSDPTWSPDGARLAYILRETAEPGQPNRGVGFGVVNSDGTGETIVAGPPAGMMLIDGSLKWSPDGKRLAFQRGVFSFNGAPPSGDEGIYTVNVDGTGLTQLARLQDPPVSYVHSLDNLAWSPDGAHIAYKDGSTLNVINSDGSGPARPLLVIRDPNNCTQYTLSPIWLAGGQRIAYNITGPAFAETFADFEIHIAQIDGSGDINATNNPGYDNFLYPIAGGGC